MFSSFFSCPSLFSPFFSLVLGLGFLFWVRRFGVSFPSPFFLRHLQDPPSDQGASEDYDASRIENTRARGVPDAHLATDASRDAFVAPASVLAPEGMRSALHFLGTVFRCN